MKLVLLSIPAALLICDYIMAFQLRNPKSTNGEIFMTLILAISAIVFLPFCLKEE